MAIVIYDPYPEETTWRNSIAEIDTPLHSLEYGIMSELISDYIKNLRKTIRHNKVVKLIKKIHNDRLDDVWREIISDAKKLPNYCRQNWVMGRKNKPGRVDFFEKNDISIQYLEDAMEVQMGGNPEFQPGDLVIVDDGGQTPCIIREKIHRGKFYKADVCVIEWVKSELINPEKTHLIGTYQPIPIWHRYRRLNPMGGGLRMTIKVDSWKCKKVGVETPEIVKDRNDAIERYNKELKKRVKFYKDIIRPLLEPDYCWSYVAFNDQKIDVWKLTKPPHPPYQLQIRAYPHRLTRWNMEWEIIIDNIIRM